LNSRYYSGLEQRQDRPLKVEKEIKYICLICHVNHSQAARWKNEIVDKQLYNSTSLYIWLDMPPDVNIQGNRDNI